VFDISPNFHIFATNKNTMAYKLNKKLLNVFVRPYAGKQVKFLKLGIGMIDFSSKEKIDEIAENQELLGKFYQLGFKWVSCTEKDCCQKPKACTKKDKVNGVKEKAVKKEKQVSKASKKE
tara:strand:- start:30544 stop:30903 length:360 start_codon:yes stop_codon:yes gene_type:complete